MFLAYVRTSFDLNNYESPVQKEYFELYQLQPSETVSQSIKFSMKNTEIYDVLGLPYKQRMADEVSLPYDREFTNQNRVNQSVVCTSASCETYFKIKFMDGKALTKTFRVYKSITQVMGEIGGIKIVIYWAFFILYLICGGGQQEKIYTVKKIFRIKEEKKTWKQLFSNKMACCKKNKQENLDLNKKFKTDESGITDVPSKIIDMAHELFQESVDLITVAQNTFSLNMMTSVLLSRYQKSVSSIVILNQYLKSKEQSQLKKSDEKQPDKTQDIMTTGLNHPKKSNHCDFQEQVSIPSNRSIHISTSLKARGSNNHDNDNSHNYRPGGIRKWQAPPYRIDEDIDEQKVKVQFPLGMPRELEAVKIPEQMEKDRIQKSFEEKPGDPLSDLDHQGQQATKSSVSMIQKEIEYLILIIMENATIKPTNDISGLYSMESHAGNRVPDIRYDGPDPKNRSPS